MKRFLYGFLALLTTGLLVGGVSLARYNYSGPGPGVYFTTTTDHTLADGYSGAVRVDQNGLIILSPSSSVGTASPLTTKGDIYTYSTTDDRLPVGTNGQVLTASSSAATGLAWGAAGSGTPGGSNKDFQYNNAGAFAGATRLTFEGSGTGVYYQPTAAEQFYITGTGHTAQSYLYVDSSYASSSSNLGAIAITSRRGAASTGSESITGLFIDADGAAGDGTSTMNRGIYLTTTGVSPGTDTGLRIDGLWDIGVRLNEQGTATAGATAYNSNNLVFRTSAWDSNDSVARTGAWKILSSGVTGATPYWNLNFYLSDDGGADSLKMYYEDQRNWLIMRDNATNYGGGFAFEKSGTGIRYVNQSDWTTSQVVFLGSSDSGNQLVIGTTGAIGQDYDHADATDPVLYIHDRTVPNTTNNRWLGFEHDNATGLGVIMTGAETGAGATPATIDNGISFRPRGTEQFRITGIGGIVITPTASTTVTTTVGIGSTLLSSNVRVYGLSGATDFTVDPQINTSTAINGQEICIWGESDTTTVKFDDAAGLQLAGGTSITLGLGDNICFTYFSDVMLWRERSRSDN